MRYNNAIVTGGVKAIEVGSTLVASVLAKQILLAGNLIKLRKLMLLLEFPKQLFTGIAPCR